MKLLYIPILTDIVRFAIKFMNIATIVITDVELIYKLEKRQGRTEKDILVLKGDLMSTIEKQTNLVDKLYKRFSTRMNTEEHTNQEQTTNLNVVVSPEMRRRGRLNGMGNTSTRSG